MLTSLELDIVQALVAQEDSQVLQILSKFEQSDHRDVGVLRDALVGIVEEITMELGDEEKAAAAFARGLDDAVREESSFVDSDDDSESLGWQRHVGFLLGQWQAQHHLTPADANTLRRMVAQRHNLLESAYEVFAGDGDASELLDTLQRVAKLQRQIEQSQAGQNVQSGVPVSDLSLEDIVREMQRRGVLQAGDAAGLLVLFHGGNEALQAANEAFMADGDVHELEETLLLVVKHARFAGDTEEGKPADESQVVSRLLAEFGRSGRLELWQIQLLMSLCKSHDARLFAAVDVYHDGQNVDELIDTLEILVELAAWERHRRAMVHDWIAPLARSGKLPRGGAERLVQLVKARDDRVVAALVVFLSDNNKEEFVDTLARIACLEAMKLKNVQADAAQDESKEGHLVLVMLKELEEKSVVSEEERKKIEDLVCGGEPRMLAAMDVLAATHDTEDFVDTARRILAKSKDDADAEKSDSVEAQEPTAAPSSIIRASPAVTTGEEEGVPTTIEVTQDAKSVSQNPENNAGDDSAVVEKEVGEKTDEMAPEERSQIAEQKGRPPELAESEEAGEENDEAAAAKEEATEEETKVVDKVDVSEEEQEEDMGKAENEPAEEQEEEQKSPQLANLRVALREFEAQEEIEILRLLLSERCTRDHQEATATEHVAAAKSPCATALVIASTLDGAAIERVLMTPTAPQAIIGSARLSAPHTSGKSHSAMTSTACATESVASFNAAIPGTFANSAMVFDSSGASPLVPASRPPAITGTQPLVDDYSPSLFDEHTCIRRLVDYAKQSTVDSGRLLRLGEDVLVLEQVLLVAGGLAAGELLHGVGHRVHGAVAQHLAAANGVADAQLHGQLREVACGHVGGQAAVQPPLGELLVGHVDVLALVAGLLAHPLHQVLLLYELGASDVVHLVGLTAAEDQSGEHAAAVLASHVGAGDAVAVGQPLVAAELPRRREQVRDVVHVQPVTLDVVLQTGLLDDFLHEVVVTRQERDFLFNIGLATSTDERRVTHTLDADGLGSSAHVAGLVTATVTEQPSGDETHSLGTFEHLLHALDVVVAGSHDLRALGTPASDHIFGDRLEVVAGQYEVVLGLEDLDGEVGGDAAEVAIGTGEDELGHGGSGDSEISCDA
ncbi:hypothetical protein ON010_g8340 [Phytophthora cinnamomi]|nr:hypothetical protein ON010_g8340 [Phytophthora cinnamomi]